MKSKRNIYLVASVISFLMGILFLSGLVLRNNEAASILVGLTWILVGVIWSGTYLNYVPPYTSMDRSD